jgi:hypothetical protein
VLLRVGFVNSVVLDLQGKSAPVASGISAATWQSGGQRRAVERVREHSQAISQRALGARLRRSSFARLSRAVGSPPPSRFEGLGRAAARLFAAGAVWWSG